MDLTLSPQKTTSNILINPPKINIRTLVNFHLLIFFWKFSNNIFERILKFFDFLFDFFNLICLMFFKTFLKFFFLNFFLSRLIEIVSIFQQNIFFRFWKKSNWLFVWTPLPAALMVSHSLSQKLNVKNRYICQQSKNLSKIENFDKKLKIFFLGFFLVIFIHLGKLYVHVSKPPKPETTPRRFLDALKMAGKENGVEVELIHTKINIADDRRAWQHERFSLKKVQRIPSNRQHRNDNFRLIGN